MTIYLSNRDGNGKTNEEGHYRLLSKILDGNTLYDDDLKVIEASTPSMSVRASAGDYMIPNPSGYDYMGWNSGYESTTISTANPTNSRISTIVLYVDKNATTSASPPNNPGITKLTSIDGTPSSSPVAPSDTIIQTSVGSGNPFIKLANVLVDPGVTSITNSKITDLRTQISLNQDLKESSNLISFVGNVIYPIGTIYENASNPNNPSTFLGFGTWVSYGQSRVTVGKDSSGTFSTAGVTGGDETVTLTEAQMPIHNHPGQTSVNGNHAHSYSVPYNTQLTHYGQYARVAWEGTQELGRVTSVSGDHQHNVSTDNRGGNQPHSNLQPYIVIYRWRRTA